MYFPPFMFIRTREGLSEMLTLGYEFDPDSNFFYLTIIFIAAFLPVLRVIPSAHYRTCPNHYPAFPSARDI